MGQIRIILNGSFGRNEKAFSAMTNGHAGATARAIEWLSGKVLPGSTALDHKLHDKGDKPTKGFDRDGEK